MSDNAYVMGSFREIDPTVEALERLREMGIPEEEITVLSHIPLSPRVLGRPHWRSVLGTIALISAVVGFLTGIFFTVITPHLYVIRVGGQPIVPLPPTALLLYEFTMLALILGTFGGFLVLNRFPDRKPARYDRQLNDGRIGILVHCPPGTEAEVTAALEATGAEDIHEPERREL